MNYFTHQSLGFDKTAIVNVPFPGDSVGTSKLDYLRGQLADIKSIQSVSFSSNTPVEDDNDMWSTFKYDHAEKETDFYAITKFSDNDYLPTYKLPLVAGRNLQPSDTVREFLVNEALVRKLGFTKPEDVIHKNVSMWDDRLHGPIVGVMKDFYNRSFRADLAPTIMSTFNRSYEQAGIKLATSELGSALPAIEKLWNQTYPDYVFEFKFLDDKVAGFQQLF